MFAHLSSVVRNRECNLPTEFPPVWPRAVLSGFVNIFSPSARLFHNLCTPILALFQTQESNISVQYVASGVLARWNKSCSTWMRIKRENSYLLFPTLLITVPLSQGVKLFFSGSLRAVFAGTSKFGEQFPAHCYQSDLNLEWAYQISTSPLSSGI